MSNNKKNNGITNDKILNDWKKLEHFSLPIYEKSSFFANLIKVFALFYKVYVENNGIITGRNYLNFDSAISEFKAEDLNQNNFENRNNSRNLEIKNNSAKTLPAIEFKDINGSFLKIKNEALCEILEADDFNIEDKLFLNRIAFMGFRKYGQQFKFKDFHKYCKKLQVF